MFGLWPWAQSSSWSLYGWRASSCNTLSVARICGVFGVVWGTMGFLECYVRGPISKEWVKCFFGRWVKTICANRKQADGRHMNSNIAILEKPKDSVMPKCSTMRLVLETSWWKPHHIKTYGSASGTRSQKPWQIWSSSGNMVADASTVWRPRSILQHVKVGNLKPSEVDISVIVKLAKKTKIERIAA